jgi:hypothetical protein
LINEDISEKLYLYNKTAFADYFTAVSYYDKKGIVVPQAKGLNGVTLYQTFMSEIISNAR